MAVTGNFNPTTSTVSLEGDALDNTITAGRHAARTILAGIGAVGWKEGRDPNAWFDSDAYLAAYRDVMAAGVNPLDHYMAVGAREGRDPSGAFDTTDYLAANPDVAAAGVNPLQHFLQFGIHEGRPPFSDGLFS